jgi:glucose/arabinose dehydrogenase
VAAFGSRRVDRHGYLFRDTGERGDEDRAQRLDEHLGKIVRLHDDGRVPDDNPFRDRCPLHGRDLFTGNRNVQGAALNPVSGELWAHEHGPNGGDELNIIRAGVNYGWPIITYGRNYGTGTKIGEGTERADVEPPLTHWIPSIAPCGMAFVTSDRYPGWKGSLVIGALRGAQVQRLELDGTKVLKRESLLIGFNEHSRCAREPRRLPMLTDSPDGIAGSSPELPYHRSGVSIRQTTLSTPTHCYPTFPTARDP